MQTSEETTFGREQLLSQEALSHSPELPRDLPEDQGQTSQGEAYSAEEQALVEERLRNLGYL